MRRPLRPDVESFAMCQCACLHVCWSAYLPVGDVFFPICLYACTRRSVSRNALVLSRWSFTLRGCLESGCVLFLSAWGKHVHRSGSLCGRFWDMPVSESRRPRLRRSSSAIVLRTRKRRWSMRLFIHGDVASGCFTAANSASQLCFACRRRQSKPHSVYGDVAVYGYFRA